MVKRSTSELRALDQAHVWHPFTAMQAYAAEAAPIIERGEGFELIDTDGNRYLDGVSSLWCNVHGHCVAEIDAAIAAQLSRIGHSTLLGLGNVPAIELAAELVRRAPRGLTRVFYSDNGATAVEVALKMAFQYHRQRPGNEHRRLFLALGGAYHGDTLGAVSVGGVERFHAMFQPLLFPTIKLPAPVADRTPAGMSPEQYLRFCEAELERVVRQHADETVAFVIEPLVQAAAGMLVHPSGYLRRVRELTAEHGLLLIADEVAVGFGRTGTLFACTQENVVPDFLCLAKGLTGGYLPLAATLTTEEVYQAFLGEPQQNRTFFHGHTYAGNPIGCAAALASLERFERQNVLENVARCSALLSQRLAEWSSWPHVGSVRQKGIMAGIELVRDKMTMQPYPAEQRRGHRITLVARRLGALVRPLGDVVVLMPPPAMPPELVGRLCEIVGTAIHEATSEP